MCEEGNDDLRIPRADWKIPAKNVEVKATWRKRSGCAVGETSSLIMDPSTREAIETGPTARSIELPRTTYTRGGTKLESEIFTKHHYSTSLLIF